MDRPELPYVTYEVTIAGEVPEEMLATFPGIEAEQQTKTTILRAVLPSRTALQSLLAVIDLFELEVVSVTPDPSADSVPETVTEAVAALVALGYTDELIVKPAGLMAMGKDGVEDVRSAIVDHLYRFEGDSDPADEAIVLGVHCPTLGVRGVVVSAYGPSIDADHEAVLRALVERSP